MPRWGWKVGLVVVALTATVWLLWPTSEVGTRLAPLTASEPGASRSTPAPSEPSHVSRSNPRETPAPEPDEERPGSLAGRVLDCDGNALVGATVTLLGDDGIIDSVKVDEEGHYQVVDDVLLATRLLAAGEERELNPLAAGEQRKLDIVVGDTREIYGWVLDTAGDPVAGVRVTGQGELTHTTASDWTDARGAFRLRYVPSTAVHVTADGGELGLSSARVARTNARRREVTLVLEPTGMLVVNARPELGSEVIVRAWDNEAHGADGVYNDYVGGAEVRPPEFEEKMMAALTDSLARFDANHPEASLVHFASVMMEVDPNVERELRRDAMKLNPDYAGAPMEAVVRAAVQKVMRDEPTIVDMMARAATYVKQGKSGMDAMMEASREASGMPVESEPYEPTEAAQASAVSVEAVPQIDNDNVPEEEGENTELEFVGEDGLDPGVELEPEGEGSDPGVPEGPFYNEAEVAPLDQVGAYDVVEEDLPTKVQRETGATEVQYAGEERAIVARGKTFEEIPLRGAFVYQVVVRHPSGVEIICGEVAVPAGETITIACGDQADALVRGRVVDTDGRPIPGLDLELSTPSGEFVGASSDKAGRFEIRARVDRGAMQYLRIVDPSGRHAEGLRQNISLRPAGENDLGTIVVREPDEVPDLLAQTPFGGVGAALTALPKGIVFSGIGPDSPLALEGVEEGTTVLAIDDQDAFTFSMEDAITMLRGDVGSEVALRLRSSEGELFEIMVQRGLIDPGGEMPDGELNGGYQPPIEIE